MQKGRKVEEEVTRIFGSGVYLLMLAERIVYVGKAKKVMNRVYTHAMLRDRRKKGLRNPPGRLPKVVNFNRVKVIFCPEGDLDSLERATIAKYQPKFNVMLQPVTGPRVLNVDGVQVVIGAAAPSDFVRRAL